MAKTLDGNPWIFTATGDAEGQGQSGEFDFPIYVHQIKLDTGDGGNFLLNRSSGGTRVLKLDNTPADDTLWIPIGHYLESFYVETLPSNASLEIYHGHPETA